MTTDRLDAPFALARFRDGGADGAGPGRRRPHPAHQRRRARCRRTQRVPGLARLGPSRRSGRGRRRVDAAGRRHPHRSGRAPPGAADRCELPPARHRARGRRTDAGRHAHAGSGALVRGRHDGRAQAQRRAVLLHRPSRVRRRRRRAPRPAAVQRGARLGARTRRRDRSRGVPRLAAKTPSTTSPATRSSTTSRPAISCSART